MGNPESEKCQHETPCSKAEDAGEVCCATSEGCCTEQKCVHPEDCTSDICQKNEKKKKDAAGCCEDEAECEEDESCCQKVTRCCKEEDECCDTEACCEEGSREDQDQITRQVEDKIAAL